MVHSNKGLGAYAPELGMTDISDQTEQRNAPAGSTTPAAPAANSASAQLYSNVTRTLTDAELVNSTAVKMLLDQLHRTEIERDDYKQFVPKYFDFKEKEAVLREKLNTNAVVDIFYGTGLALGGAAAGFVPYFFDKGQYLPSVVCGSFAAILARLPALVVRTEDRR